MMNAAVRHHYNIEQVSMGFDVDAAQIALEASSGNIESARAWLFKGHCHASSVLLRAFMHVAVAGPVLHSVHRMH